MKTTILKTSVIALLTLVASAALAGDAKELWDKNCASCHGKDGKGDTKMGKKAGVKDYTDAKFQAEYNEEKGAKAIKEGVKDNGKEVMKPFAEKLSDADIKALAAYVKTFKK
jgi:mono/diheme cytochrome c family protein